MKICTTCGAQMEDSCLFCNACGVAAPREAPAQDSVWQQTAPGGNPWQPAPPAYASLSPAAERIKTILAGGSMRTAAIFATLGLAFQLLTAFTARGLIARFVIWLNDMTGEDLFAELSNAVRAETDLDVSSAELLYFFSGMITFFSLFALIPVIVYCAALWQVSKGARNPNPGMKTTGLSLLSGLVILRLVGLGFGALGGLGGFCLTMLGGLVSGEAVATSIAAVVAFGFSAVLLVPALCYYIFALKGIASVRRTLQFGGEMPKLSVWLPIGNILTGGFGLLAAMAAALFSPLGGLAAACSCAASLALASVLFKLRDRMPAPPADFAYAPPPAVPVGTAQTYTQAAEDHL
ncbi:MAG: hypothetical protein LBC83_02535 [Oscillospiraceae bacterium]|jgi:hypothetical protein|nr:hypothetical protein [Oscillospiraceae bacterium]